MLTGENGIITQGRQAKENSREAEVREKLQIVLSNAQIEKKTNRGYNEEEFLNKLITNEIETADIRGDIVIIDGYAYELDRTIPKIGRYIGKSKDLVFPKVEISNPILSNDYKSAIITITAKEEVKGINRIEIWLAREKIEEFTCNNEKAITKEYQVNRNGNYIVKVYADLSNSAAVEVGGIVPAVEFLPNGNTTYRKEHTAKVIVKEDGEKIKNLKYKWTTNIKEPLESEFSEDCLSDTIIGNDLTGTYYLWVLLETEVGRKYICGSEGFNFDNEGPTVTLNSTPETETSFTLTATASDEYSGISKYEFYINNKLVDTQVTTSGIANYTWTGSEMINTDGYVIVTDIAQNVSKVEKEMRTKLYFWEEYDLQEKVPGHLKREAFSKNRMTQAGAMGDFMVHNNEVTHAYNKNYVKFYDGNVLILSEDLYHLNIKDDIRAVNAGLIEWEYVIKRGSNMFSIKCMGCEAGAFVKSWSKGTDGYITCNGISYNWIKEIPEGPKGECLRELFSTNELLKPKNGKDNGKWYKYIGIK